MTLKQMTAVACAAGFLFATPAAAGVYAEDLGKCLVSSSSQADQIILVQWMFSAMSVNSNVTALTKVTPEERKVYDLRMAQVVQRLLTVDCRKQTIDALKYEGTGAFESSFEVLGGVASRGLMSDAKTNEAMGAFGADLDKDKLVALYKEAGIDPGK
jgi:hypothetical protein